MNDIILHTKGLQKSFQLKKEVVKAVNSVDITVKRGEIFGLLGPNGAGKTTTLHMLATLLAIDDGEAVVAGYDVKKQPNEVRKHIGLVSQVGGSDNEATGYQDLLLQARLYGMTSAAANKRIAELAKALQLEEFLHRKTSTYSGGQKRRLNVASGIIHKPEVLFLDEPTTGLDPQNRANLWDQVRQLCAEGTTILLVTHYLEEADALSDRLAIIDHGSVIAEGTPPELKAQIVGDTILIQPMQEQDVKNIIHQLSHHSFVQAMQPEADAVRLYVDNGAATLPKIFSLLQEKKITIKNVSISQPSLDDVFLKETGRSLRDAGTNKTKE